MNIVSLDIPIPTTSTRMESIDGYCGSLQMKTVNWRCPKIVKKIHYVWGANILA